MTLTERIAKSKGVPSQPVRRPRWLDRAGKDLTGAVRS